MRNNPGIAFILGLLFGPIGIGLYFWSWGDLFLSAGVYLFFLVGSAASIVGAPLAVLIGGFCCGLYGVWRATKAPGR